MLDVLECVREASVANSGVIFFADPRFFVVGPNKHPKNGLKAIFHNGTRTCLRVRESPSVDTHRIGCKLVCAEKVPSWTT